MNRVVGARHDERGAVLVFVALAMVVLIGSTALAVDIGQLADRNRDLQAVADAVALDSARAIDGRTVSELLGAGKPVTLAAEDSAARNNFPAAQLMVELGIKNGVADFVPTVLANAVPNAVRITAGDTVDFSFAAGQRATNRKATAVQEATVGFSVGSFLASVDARGNAILDAVFLKSFGANATVLGYDGLVGSNVTLEDLGLNYSGGVLSPTELLTTSISARDLLLASAAALPQDGSHTAAINILNQMALGASTSANIRLDDFIIVEQPGEDSAAQGQLDVLSILTSSAFLINGYHAITLPASTVGIPGVGDVVIDLTVIQGPQTVYGPVGSKAETAQVELTVTPLIDMSTAGDEVNACSLRDVLGSLLSLSLSETSTCLLGGYVGRLVELELNATVPISLKAAGAEVTLTDIFCGDPQKFITLDPAPMPLELVSSLNVQLTGKLKQLNGTTLADLGPILSVSAAAGSVTYGTAPPQDFLHPSEFGVPRRVGSGPLDLAGLSSFEVGDVTLLDSDLSAVFSDLTAPASTLVNDALGSLDTALVESMNEMLGLNVGGADLTAIPDSLDCQALRLAE